MPSWAPRNRPAGCMGPSLPDRMREGREGFFSGNQFSKPFSKGFSNQFEL